MLRSCVEVACIVGKKLGSFSVQPQCSLCLCGESGKPVNSHHRDTDYTDVPQRRTRVIDVPNSSNACKLRALSNSERRTHHEQSEICYRASLNCLAFTNTQRTVNCYRLDA